MSAQNLVDAIAASKRSRCRGCCSGSASATWVRPPRNCSRATSGRWTLLRRASADDILALRGIGETIAVAVVAYFDEPKNRKSLERLEKPG